MPPLTLSTGLLYLALVLCILAAVPIGYLPLWPAVLVVIIALLVRR